jgi:hypothetical protein
MWKHTHSRLGLLAVVAALGLLALPAAAAAQETTTSPTTTGPTEAQYGSQIPGQGTAGASAGTAGTSGTSSPGGLDSNIGSLPFTGLDLIVVAGLAFVLTGTGFALRRLSTPRDPRV